MGLRTETVEAAPTSDINVENLDQAYEQMGQSDPGLSTTQKAVAVVILVLAAAAVSYGAYRLFKWLGKKREERKGKKSEWADSFGKDVGLREAMLAGASRIVKCEERVDGHDDDIAALRSRVDRIESDEASKAFREAMNEHLPEIQKAIAAATSTLSAEQAAEIAKAIAAEQAEEAEEAPAKKTTRKKTAKS